MIYIKNIGLHLHKNLGLSLHSASQTITFFTKQTSNAAWIQNVKPKNANIGEKWTQLALFSAKGVFTPD